MSTKIIRGKQIANKIESELKEKIDKLKKKNIIPKLGVVYIGKDEPSENYIKQKQQKASELGINFELFSYSKDISTEKAKQKIKEIQNQSDLDGLIIQLPIPGNLYPALLDEVKPEIDVDCLTSENLGLLVKNKPRFQPPTAGAILEVLNKTEPDLKGKKVTLVGTGLLVGKPLANILINKEVTLTTCNEYTKNLTKKCRGADIIISGVGEKHLITKNMISQDTIVIDTGIDYVDGEMYGDVDFEQVQKKANFITPTPGGIGPITVAKLFENVVKSTILNQT